VVFAIAPLEVLALLAGLAAVVLPADFASPLVVDFFSAVTPALDFDEAAAVAVVVFGFVVPAPKRGETFVNDVMVLEATVAAAVVVVVVFAVVILPLVLETLVVPSSCLGRAAGGFFAAVDCAVVARTVVLTAFEGEVGVDFVAVFVAGAVFVVVVVLFVVGRFAVVEDVAFVFVEHAVVAAVTATAVAAAAS
jgi:hypothetical protein